MSKELTTQESGRLEELEAIIQRWMIGFWEIGEAYREVRESRLYPGTWKQYCEDRWNMERGTVDRIIRATEVRALLAKGAPGALLPSSEKQTRPLVLLDTPEDRVEVWEGAVEKRAAVDGKPPTFLDVERAVKAHMAGRAVPDVMPDPAPDRAFRAQKDVRDSGEAFVSRVRTLMDCLDLLSSVQQQAIAHSIVVHIHTVVGILEEGVGMDHAVSVGLLGADFDASDVQEAQVVSA